MSDTEPLVAFEETGQSAVLNYNIPTSSTYHSHRLVDLQITPAWFTDATFEAPPAAEDDAIPPLLDPPPEWEIPRIDVEIARKVTEYAAVPDPDQAKKWQEIYDETKDLLEKFIAGVTSAREVWEGMWRKIRDKGVLEEGGRLIDERLAAVEPFIGLKLRHTDLWMNGYSTAISGGVEYADPDLASFLHGDAPILQARSARSGLDRNVTDRDIVSLARRNLRLVPKKLQSGRTVAHIATDPEGATPRLLVVEYYRVSSYLGNYGAGRTVNTFTLLPGEESTITIRTWRQIEESLKSASSILDSYDTDTAEEFQLEVVDEQSDKSHYDESESWNVEASASSSWGFGRASVKAGAESSYNSSRDDFARNVETALTKHVAKAAHHRKVEINSSTERRVEEGEEVLVTRTLKNINLSRVLNFVFRELNQEFITYLHLADIRVAFVNGYPQSTRVVPLSELDDLLTWAIKTRRHRAQIKDSIVTAYSNVMDHWGERLALVETVQDGDGSYLRTTRRALSDDSDLQDGQDFDASTPGAIVRKTTTTLPTDALIVDALLGEGVALDDYALDSQLEKLRDQRATNAATEADVQKLLAALQMVEDKDAEKVALYRKVFCRPDNGEQ